MIPRFYEKFKKCNVVFFELFRPKYPANKIICRLYNTGCTGDNFLPKSFDFYFLKLLHPAKIPTCNTVFLYQPAPAAPPYHRQPVSRRYRKPVIGGILAVKMAV